MLWSGLVQIPWKNISYALKMFLKLLTAKKWKEILSRLNGGRQDENAAHIHTKIQ